ncbi:unnamed protein product, partial [Amoebophrya sp. A120]
TCSSALLRSLQLCLEKIFYSLASACGRSTIRACSALLAARYSSSSCGLLVLRSPSGAKQHENIRTSVLESYLVFDFLLRFDPFASLTHDQDLCVVRSPPKFCERI